MDITITNRTRTREILPFLTTSNIMDVVKQVPLVPLDTPLQEMSLEDFDEMLSSPENYTMKLAEKNRRAIVFLGKVRDMYAQLENFQRFLKQFEVNKTSEENLAAIGIPFPDFGNSMLTTVIKFYHLKSVDEAVKMPLKSWMLAFHSNAAESMYSRKYSEITTKNAKNEARRKK